MLERNAGKLARCVPRGLPPGNWGRLLYYIADWRLTQLKLTPLFGYFEENQGAYQQRQEHPIPWLISILNGVEHANFFEQRATEYAKTVTQGQ